MSLYSMNEICYNCIFAKWHECEICGKISFCHCIEDQEEVVNNYSGICKFKEEYDD